MSTLLLTRHAETVWHAENRYAGADSDVDLTAAGVRQAERLAAWVRTRRSGAVGADRVAGAAGPIAAVVSSPVRRARETAAPAALAAGVPVETVADLREVGFGIAEGRTLAELDPEVVAAFRGGRPFPGAEPPDPAAERVAAALRDVAARHPDRTVLVVAHSTALRLGLCALLGLPPARYRQVFPRMANVAIAELALGADGPAGLLSLNVPCSTTKE